MTETRSAAMDLAGPTAEDDIRRIIGRYGAEAVKAAIEKATRRPRGRAPHKDWLKLTDFLDEDVQDWLDGRDPFVTRSDYSIAEAFAAANPGQSHSATAKRIRKKLKAKQARKVHVLARAWQTSRGAYPHGTHLRTLRALHAIHPAGPWGHFLSAAESFIADHSAKFGPPAEDASMEQIEKRASTPLSPIRTGLLASFANGATSGG